MLKTWFLTGDWFIMDRQVTISVVNPPDWAAVAINPSTPAIGLGNTWQETMASLVIACHDRAPAEPYILKLKAELPAVKHVSSAVAIVDIVLTPEWQPYIDVYTETPNLITPPGETTNVTFTITNKGNGWTLIQTEIQDIPGWSLDIDPAQFMVDIGQSEDTILHIRPPATFFGVQSINLSFTPTRFDESGSPVPVTIQAGYSGFHKP